MWIPLIEDKDQQVPLNAGLYILAMPIGHVQDVTLRALQVLMQADVIYCEDTRKARSWFMRWGFLLKEEQKLKSYHDFSSRQELERLLQDIKQGKAVAYISDAGSPLIADPGYRLVRAVVEAGCFVDIAPGPCAVIGALQHSGLPCDTFSFLGFFPKKEKEKLRLLKMLSEQTQSPYAVSRTFVFYETAVRLKDTLESIQKSIDQGFWAKEQLQLTLCREMTKQYQEVHRFTFSELMVALQEDRLICKGEFSCVLHVALPDLKSSISSPEEQAVWRLLEHCSLPVKERSELAALLTKRSRRECYHRLIQT